MAMLLYDLLGEGAWEYITGIFFWAYERVRHEVRI
jgi:hypothetical protein